jgi:3,4-dihydroxy 2-butanone 4-phosphate synthase/GTP cyclohydrolase II
MNTIEEIIEAIRQGQMVIIMDDEDRENEGDLLMAADSVRAEDINFMARYGRGLICLTLTSDRCQQLRLPLMVTDNNAAHATNFTVSIEAAKGVTTGISAADRAKTVLSAVAKEAKAEDVVQPGHIFPLRARDGGVLNRAGHTEAGCDLARLAGTEPAAVIVEILNEDGSMARRPELEIFAKKHHLKIGTIADLIHYRTENEATLERISECQLPTEFGEFKLYTYQDCNDANIHIALTMGDVSNNEPVLVRVHARNLLDDVLSSTRSGCKMPVRDAMQKISEAGRGVLVLVRQEENNKALAELTYQYQLQDKGVSNTGNENKTGTWRTTGTGSQILADLGVHKIKILGAQKNYFGLSGFDLEVVDTTEK